MCRILSHSWPLSKSSIALQRCVALLVLFKPVSASLATVRFKGTRVTVTFNHLVSPKTVDLMALELTA